MHVDEFLQCRKKLEAIFRLELEKKSQKLVTNDLMDGLMQIKDEEGNKLSDQEVVDNIASLVVGGYASTSIASMWAIYYLAKHPTVLKKLQVRLLSPRILVDNILIIIKTKKVSLVFF